MPEVAAEWFIEQHEPSGGELDASEEVWVFPGARAGREFLRRIHDRAERAGRPLIPPMVITPGRLDEVVLVDLQSLAPADELEVRSAWAIELMRANESLQTAVFGSNRRPAPDEAWSRAAVFAKAVAELRGEGLDPQAHSATVPESESARWAGIAEIDRHVASRLASCGLSDPDHRRWIAAEQGSIRPWRIVAAGVLEWSGWQRLLLERANATVLVSAPEALREDFDAFGAVIPDRWIGRPSPVPESSVRPVASPDEASLAMLEAIERWSPGRSMASITVGLADASLATAAARAARAAGLALHVAEGEPLSASAPGRMIAAFAALLREPTAANAAVFLKHPHVAAWAARSAELPDDLRDRWSSAMARVREARMPRSFADLVEVSGKPIEGGRFGSAKGEDLAREREALRQVLAAVESWCAEWTSRRERSVAWAGRLAAWVAEASEAAGEALAIDEASGELRRHLLEDCRGLGEALRAFSSLPEHLDPEIEVDVWITRVLDRLGESREAPLPESGAIEALGWLELAADPAPCMVLVGLHDEARPGSTAIDPLLPERVRERLGLGSARRREARDAAILSMLAGRCERLEVIVPLRSADGDALLPSRLLLHGAGESPADRVIRFTSPQAVARRAMAPASSSGFVIPVPDPTLALPARLSVTALRVYLGDPRRFELGHVERLKEVAEAAGELDPLRYGTLAHAVLERFGGDPELRHELDPKRLQDRLESILDDLAVDSFGNRPRASILVQIRNLRRRLRRFAEAEAMTRAAGWETRHVELSLDAALELGHEEISQPFTGRIDRVDRHRETGRLRVLDYKTGDEPADPERSHHVGRGTGRWIDLQLPLYRHLLASQLGVPETSIEVGYVRLARSATAPIFKTIERWGEEVYAAAIDKAREVVRAIRARRFPMADPPAHPDAFSNLLHEPVLAAEIGGGGDS
jgi:ATP-dependent helicase/nuclease subunit B